MIHHLPPFIPFFFFCVLCYVFSRGETNMYAFCVRCCCTMIFLAVQVTVVDSVLLDYGKTWPTRTRNEKI
jgi:hypothetical protein